MKRKLLILLLTLIWLIPIGFLALPFTLLGFLCGFVKNSFLSGFDMCNSFIEQIVNILKGKNK